MSTCRKPLRASKCIDFATNRDTWELPRTAAAYDAMVEQMARAKAKAEGYRYTRFMFGYRDDARAMLRAIGITRPKETKL